MLNPFSYLRSRIKRCVLEGLADALTALESDSTSIDDIPAELAARLTLPSRATVPALPGPIAQPATSAPAADVSSATAVVEAPQGELFDQPTAKRGRKAAA